MDTSPSPTTSPYHFSSRIERSVTIAPRGHRIDEAVARGRNVRWLLRNDHVERRGRLAHLGRAAGRRLEADDPQLAGGGRGLDGKAGEFVEHGRAHPVE